MACATNHSHNWLLIANGTPLEPKKLKFLAENKSVMVLDGAFFHARCAGLKMDVLLGDFDSIQEDELNHARQLTLVVESKNQNKTDLEKGIEYIDSAGGKNILICAATGARLQHTLFNTRILKKYYHSQRPLTLITDNEIVRYHQDEEVIISGKSNDSIAVLGFPQGVITTSGLQYDVENYSLLFEKNNSISNALLTEKAKILVRGEVLIIHETESDLTNCSRGVKV